MRRSPLSRAIRSPSAVIGPAARVTRLSCVLRVVGCARRLAGHGGLLMSRRYLPLNSAHAVAIAGYARRLRGSPTASEQALWAALSAGRLGVAFRRQYRVGKFIADFAAPSRKLIVEVDGGYHAARTGADASRDAKLRRLGWRVLRFSALEVLANLPQVVEAIRAELNAP